MKNALVTGGAGFVGTNLIKELLRLGWNTVSVDNYSTGLKSNHQSGCTYIEYDIDNISDYSAFGNFDVIFHLAAKARIQPSFLTPYEYFNTNASATFKICQYCSKNTIPLIYAGSSSHHSGKFKNPYTFSKDIGEDIIQLFQSNYNLNASIARFYNVYGDYHLKVGDYCTLIGRWETAFDMNEPITIYGDGNKKRDFTHVDDIVSGLLLIYDKSSWGDVFEFGRGENFSIKQIVGMFGFKNIKYEPDKIGEAQETLCADTLAYRLLKWTPKNNIKDYIVRYVHGK